MKVVRLIVFVLMCLPFASAFGQFPKAWSSFKDSGTSSSETPTKILNAPTGGFYVVAYAGAETLVVTRLDASGAVLWSHYQYGYALDAAVNSTGLVVLSGGAGVEATKFDDAGQKLWSKIVFVNEFDGSGVFRVAMDPPGNVVVATTLRTQANTPAHLGLARLAGGSGTTLFERDYLPESDYRSMTSLDVDSNGSIYVSQFAQDAVPPYTPFAVFSKFDSAGEPVWDLSREGNGPLIALDTAGNWYAIDEDEGQVEVTKFNSNANQVWNFSTEGGTPNAVAVSKAGAVAVSFNGGSVSAIRVAPNGASSWSASRFIDPSITGFAIVTDASENVYVAGRDFSVQTSLIARFDPAGGFRWSQREQGSASDPASNEYFQSLVVDPLGRIVALSSVNNVVTLTDLRVTCYNTQGARIWSTDIDTAHTRDVVDGASTDSAGNTYVTGHSSVLSLAKFSPGGSAQWIKSLSKMEPSAHILPPQAVNSGGAVVLQVGDVRSAVYRYDASGNQLWTYSTVPTARVVDFNVMSNGFVNLLFSGSGSGGPGQVSPPMFYIIRLNTTGGVDSYFFPPNGVEGTPAGLTMDGSGNMFVSYTFATQSPELQQPRIAKFGTFGFQWTQAVGNQSPSITNLTVGADNSGGSLAAFLWEDPQNPGTRQAWVVKCDTNGEVLWSTQALTDGNPKTIGHITVDANGNAFLVGDMDGANKSQYGEIEAITAGGAKRWASIFSLYRNSPTTQIVPDNVGGATVGATGVTTTREDYEVIKFADGGTRVWANGGLYSNGRAFIDVAGLRNRLGALTTDASGNLYVTGWAWGPSNSFDFNVVKLNGDDSHFDSMSVSTSMTAHQSYPVTVKFTNTGTNTWTNSAGYRVVLTDGSSTWGLSSAPIATSVSGGAQGTITFNVTAPITPGTYYLTTKMYRNGFGSFGQISSISSIIVGPALNDAVFVSISAPNHVTPFQHFTVTVDIKNNGSNAWTKAGGYALAVTTALPNWGNPLVSLSSGDSIAFGQHKIFTISCIAPGASGTYQMTWRMKIGATFFGDQSIPKTITVTP